MAKKIPIDQLAAEVNKILAEYGDNVQQNMNDIVSAMTKKGAKAVRSEASGAVGGTGKYASGWTSQTETGRVSAQGTIYNAKVPGLPHLLEHGHALRGGGRSRAFPHIAKVEEALVKEFESKVKSRL